MFRALFRRGEAANEGEAAPPPNQRTGIDTAFASDLVAASEAALACNADSRLFVNECEAVLARFAGALSRLKMQKFADEGAIVDKVQEKEAVVHFLFDCVRNRLTFRRMVGKAKDQLSENSRAWARAFQAHVKSCPTCMTVEFDRPPQRQSAPPVATVKVTRPIPFILELLAIFAVALPTLAMTQGNDCWERWQLFIAGSFLLSPALVLIICCCRFGKARLAASFLSGNYAVRKAELFRELGVFWAPSRHSAHCEYQAVAPANPEEQTGAKRCRTFGWWSRWAFAQPGAIIEGRSLAFADSVVDVQSAPLASNQAGGISSSDHMWDNRPVALLADGRLAGWPLQSQLATFDGSAIKVVQGPTRSSTSARRSQGPEEGALLEVWIKTGLWRWDFVLKVVLVLAALGLAACSTAVMVPPGLDIRCIYNSIPRHLPLKAVFLLDGSGSISSESWTAEKQAAKQLSSAFVTAYEQAGRKDAVNLGVVQFTEKARVEVAMTNDTSVVEAGLDKMKQVPGGTNFGSALKLCTQMLSGYTQAGPATFDVCVLVTDGETDEDADELRKLVNVDTAVFGIYVGQRQASEDELRQISSCGAADHSPSCHFFASATDFKELGKLATQIAAKVVRGSGAAFGKADHGDMSWLLPLLFAAVPFALWLIYLQIPARKSPPPANPDLQGAELRAPLRLRAAGRNEGRPSGQQSSPRTAGDRG
eukprot:CAMPEP_0178456452 /NCGR_PEP_ID=MMETSP0689_2-20121128/46480_1 /TAXON_ID=160604 /ORGANISM="Amphidinium massartii, Strain CS-259" /LENGTH=706 /DNA_ID=CAMNT_0020082615 /DNA_START=30 /DNA_END=2146 /DNA_ORIENTATION=-